MNQSLREQVNDALKTAVKAQDRIRVSTLRLINAAIKDRDIQNRTAGRVKGVSDDEVLDILVKMVKQRRESVQIYEEAGRIELAEREQREIDVIQEFLPRQLGEEEARAAVKAVIGELDAEGLKDMGRVMGALKERYAGQMDFARASAMAKELLG
ncbi:GatB/YqeY domain-containing protein [Kaustia mangrovi]|uniref:GatB/YqeY domain-containing protein n=1 Tax=Kaustia mangrovi TaxID=2593653 RepID=A0A7S8HAF7_9HYPH|nr:GatB/YqeY domain-containing protein [Kaustia mangrovi]QPC41384.1 GatB/YqeY domain-containing protein [Kaustia mangrovi]